MVQQDTPGTSDVPKRSSLLARYMQLPALSRKKKFIYIVLPLILINAGVAHRLVNQVALRAGAQTEVKDQSVTLPAVDEFTSTDAEEASIEENTAPIITTYVVTSGDTLSGIAQKFNITVNTIRWANDLTEKSSKINIGDELVILPVSGVEHTVKKGETLSGIASKYDANQEDILKYNDIEANAIKPGTSLIIPGAEPIVAKAPIKKQVPVVKKSESIKPTETTSSETPKTTGTKQATATSDYAVPVRGILTQGIHDRNAVDFGVSVGTTVVSFKSGTVIVAKNSGYNGGYGSYIVVNHEGSCQTQYSHLSKVDVAVGDRVAMGETIGLSGNTGRSTGPHLHFNVTNCGGNPFFKYKVGTKF